MRFSDVVIYGRNSPSRQLIYCYSWMSPGGSYVQGLVPHAAEEVAGFWGLWHQLISPLMDSTVARLLKGDWNSTAGIWLEEVSPGAWPRRLNPTPAPFVWPPWNELQAPSHASCRDVPPPHRKQSQKTTDENLTPGAKINLFIFKLIFFGILSVVKSEHGYLSPHQLPLFLCDEDL